MTDGSAAGDAPRPPRGAPKRKGARKRSTPERFMQVAEAIASDLTAAERKLAAKQPTEVLRLEIDGQKLGKKIEQREMKLAMLYVLVFPLSILGLTAWAASVEYGTSSVANAGPHGLAELLYAYTSATANMIRITSEPKIRLIQAARSASCTISVERSSAR